MNTCINELAFLNFNFLSTLRVSLQSAFILQMHLLVSMTKAYRPVLMLLVLLAIGISSAEVPDLSGKWNGSWTGYDEGKGLHIMTENESLIFNFTEQKDRIFAGNISIVLENGIEIDQGFAGAIGLDNRTLYIAEFGRGYAQGTIISNDEIELIYLADGKNGSVAIDRLYRANE